MSTDHERSSRQLPGADASVHSRHSVRHTFTAYGDDS